MTVEETLWTPYMHKTNLAFRSTPEFPVWLTNTSRIEVYGNKSMMMLGRHGNGWQVFGRDGEVLDEEPGDRPMQHHMTNFFECVKSRKQPNADILDGHRSTLLCQLGNISYRIGGQRIFFDVKTESILDNPQAQQLAKRVGQDGYSVPEAV